MHEFSIARNIIEIIVKAVEDNTLIRVDTITVEAGELRQIVPESLEMAFDALKTEGNRSEEMKNCRLKLIIIPQVVSCRDCECEFYPEDVCYLCPQCGSVNTAVIEGDGLIIKSIEGETAE